MGSSPAVVRATVGGGHAPVVTAAWADASSLAAATCVLLVLCCRSGGGALGGGAVEVGAVTAEQQGGGERYSDAVGQMVVAGRVEDGKVGPGPRSYAADVVAAQGPGTAGGDGPHGLG